MNGWKPLQDENDGFSLLELLVVLAILSLLAGLGAGGSKGVRQWLAVSESKSLFMEIENACQLYRMERSGWPPALMGGEADLNAEGREWRDQLAPYMERQVVDRVIEDGFGNTRIYLLLDEDGDHWIEPAQFKALKADVIPSRIWSRVALYSTDGEDRLVVHNWGHHEK